MSKMMKHLLVIVVIVAVKFVDSSEVSYSWPNLREGWASQLCAGSTPEQAKSSTALHVCGAELVGFALLVAVVATEIFYCSLHRLDVSEYS
jgi:hypothetical protein